MSGDKLIIDPSARMPGADIWFVLPAGFVPLPLKELAGVKGEFEGVDDVLQPVSRLVAGLNSSEHRQELNVLLTPVLRMFHVLAGSGVIHCSLGLHRDDDGSEDLLLSLFTLSWREIAWAPRSVIIARLAAGMQDALHVELLDLPSGPACLAVTRLSSKAVGMSKDLIQIAAYVPYPDATKLAVLTVATNAVQRVDDYRDLLRETARMVRFESPLSAERGEV